ncbi:MAG TPA: hypothetical protein VN783_00635 [Thermoanaerobaculia bacterium]|nr:hypothetical protein [Thermoanaerobaculia bacterium]
MHWSRVRRPSAQGDEARQIRAASLPLRGLPSGEAPAGRDLAAAERFGHRFEDLRAPLQKKAAGQRAPIQRVISQLNTNQGIRWVDDADPDSHFASRAEAEAHGHRVRQSQAPSLGPPPSPFGGYPPQSGYGGYPSGPPQLFGGYPPQSGYGGYPPSFGGYGGYRPGPPPPSFGGYPPPSDFGGYSSGPPQPFGYPPPPGGYGGYPFSFGGSLQQGGLPSGFPPLPGTSHERQGSPYDPFHPTDEEGEDREESQDWDQEAWRELRRQKGGYGRLRGAHEEFAENNESWSRRGVPEQRRIASSGLDAEALAHVEERHRPGVAEDDPNRFKSKLLPGVDLATELRDTDPRVDPERPQADFELREPIGLRVRPTTQGRHLTFELQRGFRRAIDTRSEEGRIASQFPTTSGEDADAPLYLPPDPRILTSPHEALHAQADALEAYARDRGNRRVPGLDDHVRRLRGAADPERARNREGSADAAYRNRGLLRQHGQFLQGHPDLRQHLIERTEALPEYRNHPGLQSIREALANPPEDLHEIGAPQLNTFPEFADLNASGRDPGRPIAPIFLPRGERERDREDPRRRRREDPRDRRREDPRDRRREDPRDRRRDDPRDRRFDRIPVRREGRPFYRRSNRDRPYVPRRRRYRPPEIDRYVPPRRERDRPSGRDFERTGHRDRRRSRSRSRSPRRRY